MKDKLLHSHMKGFIGDAKLALLIFLVLPTIMAFTMKYVSIDVCGIYSHILVSSVYATTCGPNGVGNLLLMFNWIIPFWALGACIAVLVYVAGLHYPPMQFGIGILYLIVSVYASFYLANAFYQIVNTPPLNVGAAYFSQPLYLVYYMPALEAVVLVLYLLFGVAAWRSGEMAQSAGQGQIAW